MPRAREFAGQYHLGAEEPLLAQIEPGLPFDRALWRHLVGEVLWFAAADIPVLATAEPALECLLEGRLLGDDLGPRDSWPLVRRAHAGSRDIILGGGFYRPDDAGWHDLADVAALAAALEEIDCHRWQAGQLACWESLPVEDRQEELDYARECLAALANLYRAAAESRHLVFCETL